MPEPLRMEELPEPLLPKFPEPERSDTSNTPRSLISLLFYLLAGYWLFQDLSTLLLITFVLTLHESGHFLAMRRVGYRDLGVFFIPLLGAYVSGSKRTITERESAIVLLAGPLPGLILGLILWMLTHQNWLNDSLWGFLDVPRLTFFLILLNWANLLPIYPLDGGQLLNRVFLDEDGWVSRLFVLASAALLGALAVRYQLYPLLVFPILLLYRLWRSPASRRIEKRIERSGIQTQLDYDDLPDADYWKIRNILIEEHPTYQALAGEHISDYAPAEDRIRQAIEDQLHRTLVQDLPLGAKWLLGLVWVAGLTLPIWLWWR